MAAEPWGASDLPIGFMESGRPAESLAVRMWASVGSAGKSSELQRSKGLFFCFVAMIVAAGGRQPRQGRERKPRLYIS